MKKVSKLIYVKNNFDTSRHFFFFLRARIWVEVLNLLCQAVSYRFSHCLEAKGLFTFVKKGARGRHKGLPFASALANQERAH
jgi:hypothetical protein